jgi:hypothetical protein
VDVTKTDAEREELYTDSVRAHNEKRRLQRLWELLRHHELMVRVHNATHEAIVDRHQREIERCEALLGLNGNGKESA